MGESSEKDNIDYTYDLYRKKIDEINRSWRSSSQWKKPEDQIQKYKIPYFRDKNKDITYIHNNLISQFAGEIKADKSVLFPDYEPMVDNNDFLAIRKRFSSSEEARNFLIQRARENYNEIKNYYNEKIKNYKYLSDGAKQKLKEEDKTLDEILKKLKPLITKTDPTKKEIEDLEYKIEEQRSKASITAAKRRNVDKKTASLKSKADSLRAEKKDLIYKIGQVKGESEIANLEEKISSQKLRQETLDTNILLQKERLDIANSKIENLRKRKAEIKYKISLLENQAERNKANKKLEFKKRIDSLYDAIAKINLEIESLDKIRKKISSLPGKYEFSKAIAEDRLMMVNSKQKSMVFERKIFFEKLREEFANRLKKRINAAEKMYQQEKLIADKKINEANNRKKIAKQLITEEKEKYDDLKSLASFQKSSVSEKQALLDEVKEQIKKSKQIEADRQKLVTDSIQREIEELNSRKKIYNEILEANKDFLSIKKNEISARQTEIEKLISLETENEKIKYSEQRQDIAIQKSVFETLGDIKEGVAQEEERIADVKKTLADISEDIVTKEAVYNILNENIKKIEANELSDLKIENKILEQEIILTNKLTDETLTKTERLELLNEEKEDVIDRLENLKSVTLKKIYNTRKEIIEAEAKKTLTLSADELKSEIFSLKYEIKKLEIKKTVLEEKEDLLNFQLKNFKKELAARKKEIDLLKQIESIKRKKEREEVRQTVADIVNRIEDEHISRDVEEKLDEILDDVEDEGYDYLEDDDIDEKLEFLPTSFKDPIQSLVQKERENKMAEDIEMRDRSRKVEKYQDDYEEGETSFGDFDSNFFLQRIEDPIMRERVSAVFDDINNDNPEEMKKSYASAIRASLWDDMLDNDLWDGLVQPEEKEKFAHEQKVTNLNQALAEEGIFLDYKDPKIRSFLENNVKNTFTEKANSDIINGYSYKGKKFIQRSKSKTFYLQKNGTRTAFILDLKNIIGDSARSTIASENFMEGECVKESARQYIGQLREEQQNIIEDVKTSEDMRKAQNDINMLEKEIKAIKKNKSVKIRFKIFRKTAFYHFGRLLRFLWRNKGYGLIGFSSLAIAIITSVLTQLSFAQIGHRAKKMILTLKDYSVQLHDMGKKLSTTIQSMYRIPGNYLGYAMFAFGFFLKVLYYVTSIGGSSMYSSGVMLLSIIVEGVITWDKQLKVVNDKVADAAEATGNFIEEYGKAVEKIIKPQLKRWYYEKPTEEKTFPEIIESVAVKSVYSFSKGVQKTGKAVENVGQTIRDTLWYMKIFIISISIIIIIKWIRG